MDIPLSSKEVILLPGMLSMLAAFVYIVSLFSFRRTKRLPAGRWVAYALLAFAMFFGWQWFWRFASQSPELYAYRTAISSNLIRAAHFVAFLGPLAMAIAAGLIEVRLRRLAKIHAEM